MRNLSTALLTATLVLLGRTGEAYPTVVVGGNAAVRIDACAAFTEKLYRTNTGRLVARGHKALFEAYGAPVLSTHLGVKFTNLERRDLDSVVVTYTATYVGNHPHGTHEAVWRGRFAPGRQYDFLASGFEIGRLIQFPVRTIECRVTRVESR